MLVKCNVPLHSEKLHIAKTAYVTSNVFEKIDTYCGLVTFSKTWLKFSPELSGRICSECARNKVLERLNE